VTPEASYQMKECIPHAELLVYPEYGHAVYDEAKDYDAKILEFLKK
jgi:pimeloyl-ACP methyl ester carboxylesterase